MANSFWAKCSLQRRRHRSAFNRGRTSGHEEYIIKIPGFSGELRKSMTAEEAEKFIEKSNKSAFMEAAEASKSGMYGYERFGKYGASKSGSLNVALRAASRAFCDKRKKKES